MNKLILLLFLFTTSLASARTSYQISCDYEYDTFFSSLSLTSKFTVAGQQLKDGSIVFHHYQQNLPAYYFPEYSYGAHWHKEASFLFNAILRENNFNYTYQFNNYLRKASDVKNVFYESYSLDLHELTKGDVFKFYYADGTLERSIINQDLWINSKHVQILGCELQIK